MSKENIPIKLAFLKISNNFFFILEYNPSLPWNQETLFGYFGEILTIVVTGEGYILTNGAVLLLFISLCMHFRAFFEIFQHSMKKLEHPDQKQNYKQILCEIIRSHNLAKR